MKNPLERSEISPAQIQVRLLSPEKMSAEDLFNLMPPEIEELFLSNKGNPKDKKAKRFRRSLGDLMEIENVSPMDLLKISRECIKKNGSIDEKAFFELLEEIKQPQYG